MKYKMERARAATLLSLALRLYEILLVESVEPEVGGGELKRIVSAIRIHSFNSFMVEQNILFKRPITAVNQIVHSISCIPVMLVHVGQVVQLTNTLDCGELTRLIENFHHSIRKILAFNSVQNHSTKGIHVSIAVDGAVKTVNQDQNLGKDFLFLTGKRNLYLRGILRGATDKRGFRSSSYFDFEGIKLFLLIFLGIYQGAKTIDTSDRCDNNERDNHYANDDPAFIGCEFHTHFSPFFYSSFMQPYVYYSTFGLKLQIGVLFIKFCIIKLINKMERARAATLLSLALWHECSITIEEIQILCFNNGVAVNIHKMCRVFFDVVVKDVFGERTIVLYYQLVNYFSCLYKAYIIVT